MSKANTEFVSHGISNLSLGEKLVRTSAPKILNSLGEFGGNPWDALRASRISASKKPSSSILVPGRGIEPPWIAPHAPKACASTNFATRAILLITSNFFYSDKIYHKNKKYQKIILTFNLNWDFLRLFIIQG